MNVGLTGGIGCGKSTVVQFFAEAGWSTLETDKITHDLLACDKGVHAALRERWGKSIFRSDETVDRKLIAKRVFNDEAELVWLETLLHPLIRKVWKTALAEAPELNWLVEIPLLFEKKLEIEFDFVVCVESPSEIVKSRMSRRGYSEGQLRQRQLCQMSLEDKVHRSDYIISNAGNIDFLKQQTLRLIRQL